MSTTMTPRRPFGELKGARLQALTSLKNKQNNILANTGNYSSVKLAPSSAPTKRRLASALLADDSDEENKDPTDHGPATKRFKAFGTTTPKVSKFALSSSDLLGKSAPFTFISPQALSGPASPATAVITSTPAPHVVVPSTPVNTPSREKVSALLRGSVPARKPSVGSVGRSNYSNLAGVSKHRRFTLSSFNSNKGSILGSPAPPPKGASLPFSLEEALQGTLTSYTPSHLSKVINASPLGHKSKGKAAAKPSSKPISNSLAKLKAFAKQGPRRTANKSAATIPDSWLFDIHQDTPEQESTNFLLHNASVLDISSDDDSKMARAKDAAARGKENVPPPPSHASGLPATTARARNAALLLSLTGLARAATARRPLGEMDLAKFGKAAAKAEEQIVLVHDDDDDDDDDDEDYEHDVPAPLDAKKAVPVVPEASLPKDDTADFVICTDETAN